MSFTLEQALRKKCEQSPDLSLLLSQWDFDRELVADALRMVPRYFPHYSRHDASHSNTILVQIARVLGPARIEMLSATDIWLLLEAAYQHDIGMVLTDEQVRSWWGSPGFKDFLAQLEQSSDPELRDAARLFETSQPPQNMGHGWPIHVSRALTLAVAEYARRQHTTNSDRIIREPERTIGLLSPRTNLIPARLFRLLGKICSHHGRSFEETMKLPLHESGLGTDNAHPRFVACMLRLGDLLDLDNGRFCPVMIRSFGALPTSSKAHFEKHASINHLQVSPTRIEVEAECENYEAYEVTDQWLDWLRGELKNQMAQWSDIVPSLDFGALPSVGNIQSHIRGYLSLEAGRRPRFEVDREQTLTLVRGANIYSSRLGCMRELLQNAVDATLIRLWDENWSQFPLERLERLSPRDLRHALQSYPIRVDFQRVGPNEEYTEAGWVVSVEDKGTGISLNDLNFIQRIGASQKNTDRQRLIRAMPEWMRPSGVFGIGLQSVFLFTDQFKITTRHYLTHEALEVTLRNGGHTGTDGISIKRLDRSASARTPVGTKVSFHIAQGFISTFKHHIINEVDFDFDPILELEQDFDYEKLFFNILIKNFAQACLCPVELPGGGSEQTIQNSFGQSSYFDPQTNLEISFRLVDDIWNHEQNRLYYRGVRVHSWTDEDEHLPLQTEINIHAGRADSFLLLNREQLSTEGRGLFKDSKHRTVLHFFPHYINQLRKEGDSQKLALGSLIALLLGFEPEIAGKEWQRIQIGKENATMSLGDIASAERVELIHTSYLLIAEDDYGSEEYEPNNPVRAILNSDKTVTITHEEPIDDNWLNIFLKKTFPQHGFDAKLLKSNRWQAIDTYSHSIAQPSLTQTGLRFILSQLDAYSDTTLKERIHRFTMPCPNGFESLQHKEEANTIHFHNLLNSVGPRMALPFAISAEGAITLPHLKELVEWIFANALNPVTKLEIATTLWRFIKNSDYLMRADWENKKYDLVSARRDLAYWLPPEPPPKRLKGKS